MNRALLLLVYSAVIMTSCEKYPGFKKDSMVFISNLTG
jgi:hypothetical protein